MYEKFIRDLLLTNQFRVYSVIVETYYQKLEDLKPLLFRKWLAKELDIEEEKINPSSLGSALARYRQKSKKRENRIPVIVKSQAPNKTFPFSKDDELPKKENIIEM